MILDFSKVKTKKDLMEWFSNSFNFPDYFGRNWDAVDECLADYCKENTTVKIKNLDKISPEIDFEKLQSIINDFNRENQFKIILKQ